MRRLKLLSDRGMVMLWLHRALAAKGASPGMQHELASVTVQFVGCGLTVPTGTSCFFSDVSEWKASAYATPANGPKALNHAQCESRNKQNMRSCRTGHAAGATLAINRQTWDEDELPTLVHLPLAELY